eukprot:Skav202636  [mRNA]  locus=scaffold1942:22898:23518:- [translate_table: standard]
MMTPSGRLEIDKRLCLSMTDFHPESWNPAWSVETILVGLLSFFISDKEEGFGSVKSSKEHRKLLAERSWTSNAESPVFRQLFPEFLMPEASGPSVASEQPEATEDVQSDQSDASEEEISRPGAELERSVSPAECWICRDVTGEPLIQPCRCRGSMSGVHASCVEEWIRSHRRTARDDAPPRCSVCHHPFQGTKVSIRVMILFAKQE